MASLKGELTSLFKFSRKSIKANKYKVNKPLHRRMSEVSTVSTRRLSIDGRPVKCRRVSEIGYDCDEDNIVCSEDAKQLFLGTLKNHAENRSPEALDMVRRVFSSGRKFADYKVYPVDDFTYTESEAVPKEFGNAFSCNPFAVPSDNFALDLLTDSGTNCLTSEQNHLAATYKSLVPSIEMYSYARSTPREHLEQMFRECFGEQFNYYPALQGRAAEKMLLQATIEAGLMKRGDEILSNRPFDTTKGHIGAAGLHVSALTPLACPGAYDEASSVFMGNVEESVFLEHYSSDKVKALLMTLTDNGGGGQPVSMKNFKSLVEKSREKGQLIWVDGCRIFENALFIKAFEEGYGNKTITEISKEILSLADFVTLSFKKMYSHAGGAILINRDLPSFSQGVLKKLDGSIKRQTTTDYGNGFQSYAGLTGCAMVEIMTGLMMAVDEDVVGRRIAQVGRVSCFMKQKYDFPIIAGGHALYIAADSILPNVPLTNCPAEYLNAIMMSSIRVRGCGLGLLVYGGRVENEDGTIELRNTLTMDSLRLAVPRNQYEDDEIISRLMVVGEAYAEGLFAKLKGGLYPRDYVDNGFYHFGGEYDFKNADEFHFFVSALKEQHEMIELQEMKLHKLTMLPRCA